MMSKLIMLTKRKTKDKTKQPFKPEREKNVKIKLKTKKKGRKKNPSILDLVLLIECNMIKITNTGLSSLLVRGKLTKHRYLSSLSTMPAPLNRP